MVDGSSVHSSTPVSAGLEQREAECARNPTPTVADYKAGGCRARAIAGTEQRVQMQARDATRSGGLAAKWRSSGIDGA